MALVVGLSAVALGSCGSGEEEAASASTSSSPSGSPSTEEPPPPTVEDTAPTGKYRLMQRVVSTDFPSSEVGDLTRRVWTFLPQGCDETECSGNIESSSGLVLTYTWNGRALRLGPLEPTVYEDVCVDSETDEETPGTHFKATTTYTNSPLVPVGKDDGPPTELTGTQRSKEVTTELVGDCEDPDGVNRQVTSLTLTRK